LVVTDKTNFSLGNILHIWKKVKTDVVAS